MAKVDKINISIPHEMNLFLQGAVDNGEYATVSEVMRDAIRALQYQRAERDARLSALRDEVMKGLNSPPAKNFSFDALRDKIAAKAQS